VLKFDPRPLFTAPCTAHVPSLVGPSRQEFSAVFEALPIDRFNDFDLGTEQGARDFLEASLRGTGDIADADGKPLAYDVLLRDALINTPHIRQALIRGYVEALRGN
jgi:hypothetical protein